MHASTDWAALNERFWRSDYPKTAHGGGRRKLTKTQVKGIRMAIEQERVSLRTIAQNYNVSPEMVRGIRDGRYHKGVE